MRVKIIAEAGVNHNGEIDKAIELINVAAESGADFVKFQTFRAESLVSKDAPKAEYQIANAGSEESQYEMLKRLELSEDDHSSLIKHCNSKDIQFLSTPFDSDSLHMLVNDFDLPLIKLGSSELTNGPLLLAAAQTGRPLILSCGMSTLEEVEEALAVLAFGYTRQDDPSLDCFKKSLESDEGKAALQKNVTLLHCTSEYPTPYEDVNLRAMQTLRDKFGVDTGYSDHTMGVDIPIAAVAMGATVIEKHFTLDKALPGPDHKASLEPEELKEMISAIRHVESALGDGVKNPAESELKNKGIARKSLVAAKNIQKGDLFTIENVTIKRPGDGISPMQFWDILGQTADKNYEEGQRINK